MEDTERDPWRRSISAKRKAVHFVAPFSLVSLALLGSVLTCFSLTERFGEVPAPNTAPCWIAKHDPDTVATIDLKDFWDESGLNETPHHTTTPTSRAHQQLQCSSAAKRVIVVGDVHGCFDELISLLHQVKFDRTSDALVFVGDLVNKGIHNVATLRFAREIGAISVRGNHDDKVLYAAVKRQLLMREIEVEEKSKTDKERKKLKEIEEKYPWIHYLNEDDIHHLNAMPYTLLLPAPFHPTAVDPSNPDTVVVVVHGGLVPDVALTHQDQGTMYEMRDLDPDNMEPHERHTKHTHAWSKEWNGPYFVYFGHDAGRRLQVREVAVGLDTAGVYGHQLTAAVLPGGRLVSVDVVRKYNKIKYVDIEPVDVDYTND